MIRQGPAGRAQTVPHRSRSADMNWDSSKEKWQTFNHSCQTGVLQDLSVSLGTERSTDCFWSETGAHRELYLHAPESCILRSTGPHEDKKCALQHVHENTTGWDLPLKPAYLLSSQQWCVNMSSNVGVLQCATSMLSQSAWRTHDG